MKNQRLFSLIIFFYLLCFLVKAGDSHLEFEKLTIKNGLAHNRVQTIMQDYEGFVWFGTLEGLNRFDGSRFVSFENDPSLGNAISGSLMMTIFEDRDSNLWISSLNGDVSKFNQKNGLFTKFAYQDSASNESVYVRNFTQDDDGNIWFSINSGGVGRYDVRTNTIKRYRHLDNKKNSLSSDLVFWVLADRGLIWIGTMGNGVDILDTETGIFTHLTHSEKPETLSNNFVYSLFRDSKRRIWIATDNGLNLYDKKRNRFKTYYYSETNGNSLCDNRVMSIAEDKSGRLWVATRNGLSCLSNAGAKKELFENYFTENTNPSSLSSNELRAVCVDNSNVLWIGTLDAGVNYVSLTENNIAHFKHNENDIESLSHDVVRSIFEDRDKNLWIGTDGGGLNLMLAGKNTFEHLKPTGIPSNINHNQILSIQQDKVGDMWFGSWGGGLNRLKYKEIKSSNKHFIHYRNNPTKNTTLINDIVQDIFEDRDGRLWIGTEGGLSLYNRENDCFEIISASNVLANGLSDNRIQSNAIVQDFKGSIWIGTWSGLNKMLENKSNTIQIIDGITVPPNSIRFKHYLHSAQDSTTISDNRIISIFEDSNNTLWVGTYGRGFNQFNRKNDSFIHFSEANGLPNNMVYTILEDESQNLWMSTNHGLSKFSLKDKSFRNYDELDGLQSNYFYWGAGIKRASGELVYGGTNGFNSFDPNNLADNLFIPPIYITNLQINNRSVHPNELNSPLKLPIWRTKGIVLPYSKDILNIEFVALNYIHPSKNRYLYKLEGFNENWISAGSDNSATYTNLSPGNYVFRVKGSNNDGIWNEKGTSINIVITPPYWATWWFRVIFVVVFLVFLWGLLLLKMRRLKLQREALKVMVEERTLELTDANLTLQRLNREFIEVNALLERTNEVVTAQKEVAITQRNEISKKNKELETHHYNLEELVHKRTEELLLAKDKAEESERLKASFLANMSHEIRTPLNTIVGFSSLLTHDDNGSSEVVEFSKLISESSKSLLLLIDDILELSIIEAKQSKRNNSLFNVSIFLQNFFEVWQSQFSTKQRRIVLNDKVLDENLYFFTDQRKIRQILDNLMSNACKYTEFGSVEIGFEHKDKFYIFYIKDTGIGIPQKNIDAIHNLVEDTTLNVSADLQNSRTGLSLIISIRFAALLGGKLWLESKLGFGSTFYISLPDLIAEKSPIAK